MENQEKKYVHTKVVVLTDGTAKFRESAFESINHSKVWENQVKTLGFYSEQDAQHFVDNWKGRGEMHDYKEALPTKRMEFVVYFENFKGGISEDIIHKEENWKPYVRGQKY